MKKVQMENKERSVGRGKTQTQKGTSGTESRSLGYASIMRKLVITGANDSLKIN